MQIYKNYKTAQIYTKKAYYANHNNKVEKKNGYVKQCLIFTLQIMTFQLQFVSFIITLISCNH